MDVNNRFYQAVLREMCRADDDRVGMSAVAHMLTAAEKLGFAFVPVEPTYEMFQAAWNEPNPEYGSLYMPDKNYRAIWQAMIRSAQQSLLSEAQLKDKENG